MPFQEHVIGTFHYMTAPNLTACHGFTTRRGGVSGGIYTSLNLGQNLGDDPDDVRHNYYILGALMGFDPDKLVLTRQVHGTQIRVVTDSDLQSPFTPVPEADGLITDGTNVPLMIFSADCVPILFEDPVRGAVGAVHAGWRGTVMDIAGNAIREMVSQLGCDPKNIRAAIGPCISQCCYETGDDVTNALRDLLAGDADRFIDKTGGKPHVDLKGVNGFLLERAGVKNEHIETSDECTCCLSDKYWSHRATGGKRGIQSSIIMLKGLSH